MILAFFLVLLFLIAGTVTDVRYTSRGLSKGLAVEGNTAIVKMYSDKPTTLQLYTANTLFAVPLVAPGLLGLFLHQPVLVSISLGAMGTFSVKHLRGAYRWAKLGA